MKYIVCENPTKFSLKEKEKPSREVNQALLKVHRVGICGTDLHAYSGNQAFITHRVNFQEMIANFDSWTDPKNGVIKAMVNFNLNGGV